MNKKEDVHMHVCRCQEHDVSGEGRTGGNDDITASACQQSVILLSSVKGTNTVSGKSD